MSTFAEQQINAIEKNDTDMYMETEYFDTDFVDEELEIWEKHGLTLQDKQEFEKYQSECEGIIDSTLYVLKMSSKKKSIIIEILKEIDALYDIEHFQMPIIADVDLLSKEEHCDDCEEDLEDWHERQREIRYADAIENLRDDGYDSY
jgi:hypothetical protein